MADYQDEKSDIRSRVAILHIKDMFYSNDCIIKLYVLLSVRYVIK